jgi:hypothetical protein
MWSFLDLSTLVPYYFSCRFRVKTDPRYQAPSQVIVLRYLFAPRNKTVSGAVCDVVTYYTKGFYVFKTSYGFTVLA